MNGLLNHVLDADWVFAGAQPQPVSTTLCNINKKMSPIIELITQIVILGTAIVGLYKVAKYTPRSERKESSGTNSTEKRPSSSSGLLQYFEPFFGLIGVLSFMIAIPLGLWAYMWIMNNMVHVFDDKPSKSKTEAISPNTYDTSLKTKNLTEKGLKSYIVLQTALQVSDFSKKDELINQSINTALKSEAYSVAIDAVSHLSSSSKQDEMLLKIINRSIESGHFDSALAALSKISSTKKKDDAARNIAKEVVASKKIILTTDKESEK